MDGSVPSLTFNQFTTNPVVENCPITYTLTILNAQPYELTLSTPTVGQLMVKLQAGYEKDKSDYNGFTITGTAGGKTYTTSAISIRVVCGP